MRTSRAHDKHRVTQIRQTASVTDRVLALHGLRRGRALEGHTIAFGFTEWAAVARKWSGGRKQTTQVGLEQTEISQKRANSETETSAHNTLPVGVSRRLGLYKALGANDLGAALSGVQAA